MAAMRKGAPGVFEGLPPLPLFLSMGGREEEGPGDNGRTSTENYGSEVTAARHP